MLFFYEGEILKAERVVRLFSIGKNSKQLHSCVLRFYEFDFVVNP